MGISNAAQGSGKLVLPGTPNLKPALANGEGWIYGFGLKLTTTGWGTYTGLVGHDTGDNNQFFDAGDIGMGQTSGLKLQTPWNRTGAFGELWTAADGGDGTGEFTGMTAMTGGQKYATLGAVQDISGAGDFRLVRACVRMSDGVTMGRQVSSAHAAIVTMAQAAHRGLSQAFFTSTAFGSGNQRTLPDTGIEHVFCAKGKLPLVSGNVDPAFLAALAAGMHWGDAETAQGWTISDWWPLADNTNFANLIAPGDGGHGDFVLTGALGNSGDLLGWVVDPPILPVTILGSTGGEATLSQAEWESAVWITAGDDPVIDAGPVTARWKTGAGETGETTGVDFLFDILAPDVEEFGTSADRLSVFGTHMRKSTGAETLTAAGSGGVDSQTHHLSICGVPCPAYETRGHRLHMPNFWQLPGIAAEVFSDATFNITGVAYKINGTWRRISAGLLPLVCAPTDDGIWLPPPTSEAYVQPADTVMKVAILWNFSAVTSNKSVPTSARKMNALGDSNQGGKASDAATLAALFPADGSSSDPVLSQTGGTIWWCPDMAVAKGGDGRPAIVIPGDSIGFGVAHDNSGPGAFTARGEFGFVNCGLDDNTNGLRLPYVNLCVPGQGPHSWATRSNWKGSLNALKAIKDLQGAWPFDLVLTQHVENGLGGGNLAATIIPYLQFLRTEFGKPIYQVLPLVEAASTDGFRTTVNQSTTAANAYPTGDRWLFIAACEPGGSLRTGGHLDGAINCWKYESADPTGPNRDKFAVMPFATTITAAFSYFGFPDLNNYFVCDAQPEIGMQLNLAGVGTATIYDVLTNGDGKWRAHFIGGFTGATASGSSVQEVAHGDSVHPSGHTHKVTLPQGIADWKTAMDYV